MNTHKHLQRRASAAVFLLAFAVIPLSVESSDIHISPSGHYFIYRGKTLLLIGDSGTQVVPMNADLDFKAWIAQCRKEGHSTVHIWAFTGPRKGDWRLGASRGLVPWQRRADGTYNLLQFDEGEDATQHYWPRLRAICEQAKSCDMLVGITVLFGWAKAGGPSPGWTAHPFHQSNGGFTSSPADVIRLFDPEGKIHAEAWDNSWPPERKAQWSWERFCLKLIEVADRCGNVWFDYRDEWSYLNEEAARAQSHWRKFFMSRGQVWADRSAQASFRVANPDVPDFGPTPAMKTEGEPYEHEAVRVEVWRRATAGIHYLLHNDKRSPNIATWDPAVARAQKAGPMDDLGRMYVGYCSRFFNEHVRSLDAMQPAHHLVGGGNARCLAAPDKEYAIHVPAGSDAVTVDLRHLKGPATARFYDVRTGKMLTAAPVAGGEPRTFQTPDGQKDWALLIQADSL